MRRANTSWKDMAKAMRMDYRTVQRRAREDPQFPKSLLNPLERGREVSEEDIRDLVENRYLSDAEAAAELGMKVDTFTRLRQRRGIFRAERGIDRSPMTPEEIEHVSGLLDEGYSYRAVSEMTRHSHETIAIRFPGRGFTPEQSIQAAIMGQRLSKVGT